MGFTYHDYDLVALYKIHAARASFYRPCKIESIDVFSKTAMILHLTKDLDSMKFIQFLLKDKPHLKYAAKCVAEFDAIARQLLSGDKDAENLIDNLIPHITPTTREQMTYDSIERDLELSESNSEELNEIVSSENFSDLCERINKNEMAAHVLSLSEKMLAPLSSLRSDELIKTLNDQLLSKEPNTIRLISLASFCSNF